MQPYHVQYRQAIEEMFGTTDSFIAEKAGTLRFIDSMVQGIEDQDELERLLEFAKVDINNNQPEWMGWANQTLIQSESLLRERFAASKPDMEAVFDVAENPVNKPSSTDDTLHLKIFLEGEVEVERNGSDLKIYETKNQSKKLAIEKSGSQVKVPKDKLLDESYLLQAAEVAFKTSEPDASITIRVPEYVKLLGQDEEALFIAKMQNALKQVGVEPSRIVMPSAQPNQPTTDNVSQAPEATQEAPSEPEQPESMNSTKPEQEAPSEKPEASEPKESMFINHRNQKTGYINFKQFVEGRVKDVLADMLEAKVMVTSESFNTFVQDSEKDYGVTAIGEYRGLSFCVDQEAIKEENLSEAMVKASAKRVRASDIQGATKRMNEIKKVVRAEQAEQIKKLASQEAEAEAQKSATPVAPEPKKEPVPIQTPAPRASNVKI